MTRNCPQSDCGWHLLTALSVGWARFGVSTNNLSMSRDVEGVEFAEALDLIQGNIVRGQWLGRFGEYVHSPAF